MLNSLLIEGENEFICVRYYYLIKWKYSFYCYCFKFGKCMYVQIKGNIYLLQLFKIFQIYLLFLIVFCFVNLVFPRWNPPNYVFADSCTNGASSFLISVIWKTSVWMRSSFFDGVNSPRGTGRDGGFLSHPWDMILEGQICGVVLESVVVTNDSSLVNPVLCVPRGLVPGSFIHFSNSPNCPV